MEARRLAKEGRDPLAERGRVPALTFEGGGRGADREQAAGLAQRQARRAVGLSTLATYAYPTLGALDVKAVDTQAVLDVLRPSGAEKPETASRVRQRFEAVLDYAAGDRAPAPARTRRAGAATSTTCSPSRAR
jgi:hypothetical protein